MEKKIAVQLNRLGLFLYIFDSTSNKQSINCPRTRGRRWEC